MKCGIGQSSQLKQGALPSNAVAGRVGYPSQFVPGSITRAAVWVVDFPTIEALCAWIAQWHGAGIRRAEFDDETPTWLLTVHQEYEE